MQRGQFALTGTTLIDGKSTAFLRETAGGKSRRVHQGETINGMTVAEVKPDRVRLTLGDESEDLVLQGRDESAPDGDAGEPVRVPRLRAGAAACGRSLQQGHSQPRQATPRSRSRRGARRARRAQTRRSNLRNGRESRRGADPDPGHHGSARHRGARGSLAGLRLADMYQRYAQPVQPLVPK